MLSLADLTRYLIKQSSKLKPVHTGLIFYNQVLVKVIMRMLMFLQFPMLKLQQDSVMKYSISEISWGTLYS